MFAFVGCHNSSVCKFSSATPAQVGQAIAENGDTESFNDLFGPTTKPVWNDSFKELLSKGNGGEICWQVKDFMGSTEGRDRIELNSTSAVCTVKFVSEKQKNGILPGIIFRRNMERERSILQKSYWSLKQTNPNVTVHMEGSWQPSDPPIIELHNDALWTAAKNLPFEQVVKELQGRGFAVDAGVSGKDRVELSGSFSHDPFGIMFQNNLLEEGENVSLIERAVVKRTGDIVIVGLWAKGKGSVKSSLPFCSTTKRVSSSDNMPAMKELLWKISLNYSISPLPPAPYVENIQPSTCPTTKQ